MVTLLLVIIYIAFISLGIPDSLFGTAWPAIYSELTLPISYGSFVTIITSSSVRFRIIQGISESCASSAAIFLRCPATIS